MREPVDGSGRKRVAYLLIGLLVVALTVTAVHSAGASTGDTASVSNCRDTGAGSLRQVIDHTPAGGTVAFAPTLRCSTITLDTTITIGRNLAIDGPGTHALTINGSGDVGVFDIDPGVAATISGLTVTGGHAVYGGGIYNGGTLTLVKTDVTDSDAATGGGGIWSNGRLTVERSELTGNHSGYFGGGIYSGPSGALRIVDSTLTDNRAVDDGIDFPEYAYGGGIYADGTATLAGSTLTDNGIQCVGGGGGGGAIYAGGTLVMTNSTLSDNNATIVVGDIPDTGGGGILNTGTLTVDDSIVSGNSTNVDGGGIANGWRLTVRGGTLTGNTAGGSGPDIYSVASPGPTTSST